MKGRLANIPSGRLRIPSIISGGFEMADDVKKCKHTGCKCMAERGSDYCSTICKDTEGTTTLQCDCGHSACNSAKL